MAPVREALRDFSSRVEDALHKLEEVAHEQWDRMSVKDRCGRAEAAALTLESLIREISTVSKPMQDQRRSTVSNWKNGCTVEREDGFVQAPLQGPQSAMQHLSKILSERCGRHDGIPLFAHVSFLHHFRGGVESPRVGVASSEGDAKASEVGVNYSKDGPEFSERDAGVVRFNRSDKVNADSLHSVRLRRKGGSSRSAERPPFAALSWPPGFLGGGGGGGKTAEDGAKESSWLEEVGKERRRYFPRVNGDGSVDLAMEVLVDKRPLAQKLTDGFRDKFFPVGYPESVAEGYQVYSQWRAVQHFTSAILGVLSTQSVLFAAGLRPTPAQATVVSWVLKEGMQHVGKLVGSSVGPRMDADPKKWRIIADVMYDVGAACEIVSPLVPRYFLPVAGAANLAKGIALLAARSTRLPIYTAFAKHGNVGDLYAKGEALSVLSNVAGMWLGIQLASGICASAQGKLLAFPLLSGLHVFCVAQEMRAAPMNFLNAQRTALLVEDYVMHGVVRTPPELRYRERLLLPSGINMAAGGVRVGAPVRTAVRGPKDFAKLRQAFKGERFLLNVRGGGHADMVLHRDATGEDVLKGWLLAAYIANDAASGQAAGDTAGLVKTAYRKLGSKLPSFLEEVKRQGWQTRQFHEGAGKRAVW